MGRGGKGAGIQALFFHISSSRSKCFNTQGGGAWRPPKWAYHPSQRFCQVHLTIHIALRDFHSYGTDEVMWNHSPFKQGCWLSVSSYITTIIIHAKLIFRKGKEPPRTRDKGRSENQN